MTNERKSQREMTPEEERAARINISRKTLESKVLQGVMGINNLRSNPFEYGQLALNGVESSYQDVMASKELQEIKKGLYKQKSEKGKELGAFGEPSISNYDVSVAVIEQLYENMERLPLGDLGDIVGNLGKSFGYDFKVPEALKGYVPAELQEKIQLKAIMEGKSGRDIKPEEALTEQEIDAMNIYQRLLQPAYVRSAAIASAKSSYFADINGLGKQYAEKYKSKEDSKSGD